MGKRRRSLPWFLRETIYLRDLFHCRYCHTYLRPVESFHVDHVKPYSQGGLTVMDNLVLACADCNLKKGAKTWVPLPIFPLDIDELPPHIATDVRLLIRRKHAESRGHAISFAFSKKWKRKWGRKIQLAMWSCSCGVKGKPFRREDSDQIALNIDEHLSSDFDDRPTDEEVERFAETGEISRPPWL